MGTAVNRLMESELEKRLRKEDALRYSSNCQHYYDFSGSHELRKSLAKFFHRHFDPIEDIHPDNVCRHIPIV